MHPPNVHSARLAGILAIALIVLNSALPASGQQSYSNLIVKDVTSPDISPGGSGTLSLQIYNPYNTTMGNATLSLSVYAFSTDSKYTNISSIATSSRPYFIISGTQNVTDSFSLQPGQSTILAFAIQTNYTTPHGSFFNEGTYFVYEFMSFYTGTDHMRMASKGFFTEAEWSSIFVPVSGGVSHLNYTYLNKTLGFSGILPDVSFGVNTPSPTYLFFAAGSAAFLIGAAAVVSYLREKRGGR
jgi:hypothetical protein